MTNATATRLRSALTSSEAKHRAIQLEMTLSRIGKLVTRLLELSRADSGFGLSEVPHDLVQITQIVLNDARHDLDKNKRLIVDLPETPVFATIDPDAFAVVVGNLIENAFTHGLSSTPVWVSFSRQGIFRIVNHGSVVSVDEISRIRDRFVRSSGSSSGSGLGLSIVDLIAKHTGANLQLFSPAPQFHDGFEARFIIASRRLVSNLNK